MRMLHTLSFCFLVNTIALVLFLNSEDQRLTIIYAVLNGFAAFITQVATLIGSFDDKEKR